MIRKALLYTLAVIFLTSVSTVMAAENQRSRRGRPQQGQAKTQRVGRKKATAQKAMPRAFAEKTRSAKRSQQRPSFNQQGMRGRGQSFGQQGMKGRRQSFGSQGMKGRGQNFGSQGMRGRGQSFNPERMRPMMQKTRQVGSKNKMAAIGNRMQQMQGRSRGQSFGPQNMKGHGQSFNPERMRSMMQKARQAGSKKKMAAISKRMGQTQGRSRGQGVERDFQPQNMRGRGQNTGRPQGMKDQQQRPQAGRDFNPERIRSAMQKAHQEGDEETMKRIRSHVQQMRGQGLERDFQPQGRDRGQGLGGPQGMKERRQDQKTDISPERVRRAMQKAREDGDEEKVEQIQQRVRQARKRDAAKDKPRRDID